MRSTLTRNGSRLFAGMGLLRGLKALLLGGVMVTALAPAPAQAQYPSPTPDFAHPGGPSHYPRWNPSSGARDRPVLVIYVAWDNTAFPAALDSAQLSRRFFGGFPSVSDYFVRQSFGVLNLTPAAEIDNAGNGAVNDGVVRVTMNMLKADFLALPETDQNRQLLQAVDWAVNFASFDSNNDGELDPLELVANVIESDTAFLPTGAGKTRNVDAMTLDGKGIGNLMMSQATSATNLITIVHENWHNLFGTRDFYGFGTGRFDISGPTIGMPDPTLFAMAAWEKLHLGWITPTVVTRDGYYDVREGGDVSRDAFVLYDHAKGTNDYFIVENRRQRFTTYDRNASDQGLVIWRLDETKWNSPVDAVRGVDIMRPDGSATDDCDRTTGICYGGEPRDAWDPADMTTPQRAMTRSWRDGSASRVAVRAVGCAAETMRAFFDVRGPGVLVDPFALDNCTTPEAQLPHLTPGDANPITFAVMNTGETSDSFDFVFENLPAGWTATTRTQTIAADSSTTATVLVTPALGAAAGQVFTLRAVGRSRNDGSVSSSAPLRVKLNPKISVSDVSVIEGDSGSGDATFVVSLSEATDREVTVDYTTADATAQAPDDYASTSGRLTFGPGSRTRLITVAVKGDTAPEPDETFFVRLTNASGAKLADGEAVGTIRTDPEPSASIADATLEEETARLDFTVTLSEANNTPVAIDFATLDDTANAPADYEATSGTVEFPVGETSKTVSVQINEDAVDELNETFSVRLSNIRNANLARDTAAGTIVDDDRDGAFSCRATGLRLGTSELSVANPPDVPCRDDRQVFGTGSGGAISASMISSTDQEPDDLTTTRPQLGDSSAGHSEAANITIRSGLNVILVQALASDARAECRGGALPQLSGSSRVTLLSVNDRPVVSVTGRVDIPLLLATVRLNQTTTSRNGVTQRAFVLDNLFGADIVIGEATAGFAGTAVHPNGSPCTA